MVTQTTIPSSPTRAPEAAFGGDWHNGVFYPYEDGEPLAENEEQAIAIVYIFGVLSTRYLSRPDVYVLMDMFIYYSEDDAALRFAPDIAVFFGALVKPPRNSWMVWFENGLLPSIVIEIASPSTWQNDAVEKREIYADIGINEYWRHDPSGELDMPILVGERLVNGRYEPIEIGADESGVLRGYSEELGLDFCILQDREPKLRLYDPVAQEWLLSLNEREKAQHLAEEGQRLAEARQRSAESRALREAEARRRAEAAQRSAEAEARELRRLLAEARGENPEDEDQGER